MNITEKQAIKIIAGYIVAIGASSTDEGNWITYSNEFEEFGVPESFAIEHQKEIKEAIESYAAVESCWVETQDDGSIAFDVNYWLAYCGLTIEEKEEE